MRRLADVDAVTLDANGTLARLDAPVPRLVRLLRRRGADRKAGSVRRAFQSEARRYSARSLRGRDPDSREALRLEWGVFLAELGSSLDPAELATAFVDALRFAALPGLHETLRDLRTRGFKLAVVAHWDSSLAELLAGFEMALGRRGARPAPAPDVGVSAADEMGARGAGMQFARAPVPTALAGWR